MPDNPLTTVQRAAAVLRNMLNVCGDDRKCQCEEAVEISEETMRVALSDALSDIPGLASATCQAVHPERWNFRSITTPCVTCADIVSGIRAAILGSDSDPWGDSTDPETAAAARSYGIDYSNAILGSHQ